jgi:ribonuclease G
LPEWLIERGIGETRSVLVEGDEIVEARVALEGAIVAGTIVAARLTDIGSNCRNAVATDAAGKEFLLPRGAQGAAQGASIAIEVTREAIPGSDPWKRPLAKLTEDTPRESPSSGGSALTFPAPHDTLANAGWNDLLDEARTGVIDFAGGELRISPTSAMTLIDVDGYLPPHELAVLGAREAANAIRRLDIGGSIGIDLPTAGNKPARQEAAAAIDAVLSQPFERTAVNGFGFIQIVRPRLRPSLIELAQDRAAFEARALLRRTAFESAGARRLVGHPAVVRALESHRGWLVQLGAQIGGSVELRADAALPMSGGYAEKL